MLFQAHRQQIMRLLLERGLKARRQVADLVDALGLARRLNEASLAVERLTSQRSRSQSDEMGGISRGLGALLANHHAEGALVAHIFALERILHAYARSLAPFEAMVQWAELATVQCVIALAKIVMIIIAKLKIWLLSRLTFALHLVTFY